MSLSKTDLECAITQLIKKSNTPLPTSHIAEYLKETKSRTTNTLKRLCTQGILNKSIERRIAYYTYNDKSDKVFVFFLFFLMYIYLIVGY